MDCYIFKGTHSGLVMWGVIEVTDAFWQPKRERMKFSAHHVLVSSAKLYKQKAIFCCIAAIM